MRSLPGQEPEEPAGRKCSNFLVLHIFQLIPYVRSIGRFEADPAKIARKQQVTFIM